MRSETRSAALRPSFLLSIDTEGDDVWSRPHPVQTRNAETLPRFQQLCERHDLRPTYLTNWEMANCPVFQELGRDVLRRNVAEIGMHLHGWDSPPIAPLTSDDATHQPYLFEYPEAVRRQKIEAMTRCLEDTFQIPILSHRAGRFGFDAVSARALEALGYLVDCSVTPNVSWAAHVGSPTGRGGADFSAFPEHAYRIDLDRIDRPGESRLLEIPMTIIRRRRPLPARLARKMLGKSVDRVFWLRPNGRNLKDLLEVLDIAESEGRDYVQFTLHSSEFMPDGSPTFRTNESIEKLYEDMQVLFEAARGRFTGRTLCEHRSVFH
ncbi:hypothetical protein ACLBWX_12565 [Methylobacterium sp. M6A4_1b]